MDTYLIWAIVAINVWTFLVFGLDKRRARRQVPRVSEARLLGLAWAAGLFGAWLGMSVFRHKTRKTGFRVKMVLVSIANLLWLVIWLRAARG